MNNSIYSIQIQVVSNTSINPNITYDDNNRVLLRYPCLTNECGYYSVVLPKGIYKIECWGAQGGNSSPGIGGKGAYTSGLLTLHQTHNLLFYLGNSGEPSGGFTFNGGGKGAYAASNERSSSGGGATDVRLVDGLWSNFESLKSRIMVAGGGGGGAGYYSLGDGGSGGVLQGQNGANGDFESPTAITLATGGTQTNGGWGGNSSMYPIFNNGTKGGFGIGGYSLDLKYGGGGGGGYYGGGGGTVSNHRVGSGAGGSSYVSGYDGCRAVQSQSTSILHSNTSIHFSGIIFQDISIQDYLMLHPSPTGGYENGHIGSGFARISIQESPFCHTMPKQFHSSFRMILTFCFILYIVPAL